MRAETWRAAALPSGALGNRTIVGGWCKTDVMCGRYVMATAQTDLVALFDVESVGDHMPSPSYNVAPTVQVPIVVEPRSKTDEPPVRRLESARWGLVPSWSKAVAGTPAFNARSESAGSKPSFKAAVERRRALVPADGWYEWQRRGDAKRPHFVHGDEPIAFAGLYEWWKQPDGAWLLSTTILTTTATGQLADLHERMPVVLPGDVWDTWLDPETDGDASLIEAAVQAAEGATDSLQLVEVDAAVGNVKNDSASLIEPVG